MSKNIVIAPCGNKSNLFKDKWLQQAAIKDFEICLLFYHGQIEDSSLYQNVDYFYHLRDFKYQMLYALFTDIQPGWIDEYDYFYFLDDDIAINTLQINQMFNNAKVLETDICQASLTQDSFCSWPIFKQNKKCFCRFVGQIEVMAPLFSRGALKICLTSFIANKSSWGMDSVWSKMLNYPDNKLVVFDNVTMRHTLPVGGGELYQKLGVSPHEEWIQIAKRYGAKKHYYKELGRLQYVTKEHTSINYLSIKYSNALRDIRRVIGDYGLIPRIKSRTTKFLDFFR